MKIAVISDIHGNYKALKAVIKDLRGINVDSTIILGDIFYKGDLPVEVYNEVIDLNPLVFVKGNTDDWLTEIDETYFAETDYQKRMKTEVLKTKSLLSEKIIHDVAKRPDKARIEVSGKRILCVHGSDQSSSEGVSPEMPFSELEKIIYRMDCDVLLCGHTHLPFIFGLNDKVIMNVGSVGRPIDGKAITYGLIESSDDEMQYSIRKIYQHNKPLNNLHN